MGSAGESDPREASLDAVLITEELARRPSHTPDHAAEAAALAELAETLAGDPDKIFQRLVDLAMVLCRADSAGLSILEPGDDPQGFAWPAIAGAWARFAGGGMPRGASPCGVVLERDTALLFRRPGRHFPAVAAVDPPLIECLLVPFHLGGRPVGTVWANAHTPDRQFDAEDLRLLSGLSQFAAAAHALGERGRRRVQQMRASEEQLRLILESATDYAIFSLDLGRTITTWSTGAAAIFGYAAEEAIGLSGDVIFTPEDIAAGAPEAEAGTARRERRAADERWHIRKDGSRFYASGVLTPLGDGEDLGFVKVLRDLTDRKRTEDALRAARDKLEDRVAERTAELGRANVALRGEMAARTDLSRRLATAQENERRRVARDLHDSVGQLLAGLSLAAKAIEAGPLEPPSVARLADVQHLADELGKQVHALAVRLRPTALDDLGLVVALGQLATDFATRTGLTVDFQAGGLGPERLPTEAETVLYRVVQEALTNVARHAKASNVSVVVGRHGGFATAAVEDDGVGFEPDGAGRGRLGLVGMRERAALIGGELEVESEPGRGTTVLARVPVVGGGG